MKFEPKEMERRIIPARAGFTSPAPSTRPTPTDHPRSRGVYNVNNGPLRALEGSSPLARGLPAHLRLGAQGDGIIPARAGFTRRRASSKAPRPDHPRSRGVYRGVKKKVLNPGGSSPLARGLPPPPGGAARPHRIIPARAGFTARRSSPARARWDHPRSRGVYVVVNAPHKAVDGSSPLARGLHPRRSSSR